MGELSDLQYKVDDDTLRVSWNLPSHNDDLQVRVSGTDGTFVVTGNPTSYKYGVIKVGKDYRLTFKVIDSKGNYSTGQTISFTASNQGRTYSSVVLSTLFPWLSPFINIV